MKTCVVCSEPIKDVRRPKTCSPTCSRLRDLANKKLYNEQNREKNKAYNRQYRLDNLEKCKEMCRVSRDKYIASAAHRPDKRVMMLVRTCRSSAKQKNLDFNISSDVVHIMIRLQNNCCALTGISFDWGFGGEYRANPFAPSIDRRDSSKGYTYDNIQIVCYAVNLAKNEYPLDVFDLVCKARIERLNRG